MLAFFCASMNYAINRYFHCSSVLTYKLDIFTGDLPEAGTSANVYIMLIGERGDTGHRKLLQSQTAANRQEMFKRSQV